MNLPLPAAIKILVLVTLAGGLLYAGHAWLDSPPAEPEATAPRQTPDLAKAAPPPPSARAAPQAGRLAATEVAQAYARSPQEADARFKGRRIQLQGVVDQTEAGQGQILLVTLGSAEDHAGLRAVVNMAAQAGQATEKPAVGQPLQLECFNQGLLMGQPVLSDCQLLP